MYSNTPPAIISNPQSADTYYNLEVTSTEPGNFTKAKADFLKLLQVNDDQDLRAQAEEQLGKLPISP